jgi:hypothetical protein
MSVANRERSPTQVETLTVIAGQLVLFHTPDSRCFAQCPVGSHTQNHELRSGAFRRWLVSRYFAETGKPPTSEAIQQVVGALEAAATFEGEEAPVYVRVAPGREGSLFIDLGDPSWRAVYVDATGWRVVESPDPLFVRPRGLRPLPVPQRGGTLDFLWDFLNLDQSDRPLVLSWITAALRPAGPYPVLELAGEQGSAKSTFATILRSLIDPHSCMLRSEPREGRDLWVAAGNSWLLAFDNLSRLPAWLSDALCRLSTGGGFAVRTLYENSEETFFDGKRPVLLAGIEGVATRGDLLDRSIQLRLRPIPEDRRRLEADLWEGFETAAPLIFGALLMALARGLDLVRTTQLDRLPRMADFAKWGESVCRGAGFAPGAFLDAYTANRRGAVDTILEDSPLTPALHALVPPGSAWEGSASELLHALGQHAADEVRRSRRWPQSPRGLAGALRRLAPALRTHGIEVSTARRPGGNRERCITIDHARPNDRRNEPSRPSRPSQAQQNTDDSPGRSGTVEDDRSTPDLPIPSREDPGKDGTRDGRDGRDARRRPRSDSRPAGCHEGDREVFEL